MGMPDGEHKEYDEENRLKHIMNFKNEKLNGPMTVFNTKTGDVDQEMDFVDGKLHGLMKSYTKGRMQLTIEFVHGKKNGKQISYADNGNVILISEYKDDLQHGETTAYNELTQEIMQKTTWVKDKKEGTGYVYYPNSDGIVYQTSDYKNDLLDGFVQKHYPNGTVQEVCEYRAGKPLSAPVYFNETGIPGNLSQAQEWMQKNFAKLKGADKKALKQTAAPAVKK